MDFLLELLYLFWFYILPYLAIVEAVLAVVVWFFLVPKLARKLTWARFGDTNIAGVADASGYFDLEVSRKSLGEGVLEIGKKMVFRFLPRPLFRSANKKRTDRDAKVEEVERAILRKYILKGLNKPIWLGYAGKVGLANPETVAMLQGTPTDGSSNPHSYFAAIQTYVNEHIPANYQGGLLKLVDSLSKKAKLTVPVVNLDLDVLKEVLPKMNTTSQMKALANEFYQKGQASKDRDVLKFGMVGMGILGMIILAIVLASML